MTSSAVTVGEDTTLVRAASTVAHAKVKRLPVVDREGVLKGIVSRCDLLFSGTSAPATGRLASTRGPDGPRWGTRPARGSFAVRRRECRPPTPEPPSSPGPSAWAERPRQEPIRLSCGPPASGTVR
ncbi:CBS domain-containing protein [Streptomyces sp. SLBN-8D4]|uniref:CBS domain-containing protein n=1 Tax=Streptomyces sp. SLBN-8D4 TaxID=3377728 RepID=UPI003C7A238B